MSGGKNRLWGYASYNDEDDKLSYTSYEKGGRVNKYTDNKDGGHSHAFWENKNDYNTGKDPDTYRSESSNRRNPSTGEVQENGGCYLTSACMKHFGQDFDDKGYELQILRWFRDNFVSKEDIDHYYKIAPQVVNAIENDPNCDHIYREIYEDVIDACVKMIEEKNYILAYDTYKNSILKLEEVYVKNISKQEPSKVLTKCLA